MEVAAARDSAGTIAVVRFLRELNGCVYADWAMVAMAVSETTIFVNSLWGRPLLLLEVILSVGWSSSENSKPA